MKFMCITTKCVILMYQNPIRRFRSYRHWSESSWADLHLYKKFCTTDRKNSKYAASVGHVISVHLKHLQPGRETFVSIVSRVTVRVSTKSKMVRLLTWTAVNKFFHCFERLYLKTCFDWLERRIDIMAWMDRVSMEKSFPPGLQHFQASLRTIYQKMCRRLPAKTRSLIGS